MVNDIMSNDSFDSDFDNQNSALRYFFLGQASYQLQSLCFHFLSMILLLIYSGMKQRKKSSRNHNESGSSSLNDSSHKSRIVSARSSIKSYLRPVVEHSIYFVLTISTFFFSALRRLGSITIFALIYIIAIGFYALLVKVLTEGSRAHSYFRMKLQSWLWSGVIDFFSDIYLTISYCVCINSSAMAVKDVATGFLSTTTLTFLASNSFELTFIFTLLSETYKYEIFKSFL